MFELQLICPESDVEICSEALLSLDALSVSVEDADLGTPQEQALFGEPGMPTTGLAWQRSVVKALFDTAVLAQEAFELLKVQDFFAASGFLAVKEVPAQDWVRLTQSQFAPVPITANFWIVPSWHDTPEAATQVIQLDPGLAFGTGTHPTTRMCLRWIAKHGCQTQRVLDYGCGSGILAIAAAKFGAASVDAVDIDTAAVESSQTNAVQNLVKICTGLPDAANGQYHTVLANILATPLKVLAPLLCGHVAGGGNLVLAGILERQADELKAAYAPYLQLHVEDSEDGWILMTGVASV
jgi:ribosomal protein L11 methyltransferase